MKFKKPEVTSILPAEIFDWDLCVSSKNKKNTMLSSHVVVREVLCVTPPTLIWFSDKCLQEKSSGKDIFGAFATGFLYASVLSDLAYSFLRFPIS